MNDILVLMVKWSLFILVLFGNSWIWKVFDENIWLGMVLALSSVSLFFILKFGRLKFWILFVLTMGVILFFQWDTTNKMDMARLNEVEKLQRQERLNFYPEKLRRVAYWWELRSEMVFIRNVERNFWQAIDPNYYFFANHPREQIGVPIIEKFSFLYFPFFALGLFQLIKKRMDVLTFWLLVVGLVLPVGLVLIVGHWNLMGPFSLFPFFVVVIALGILKGYEKIT